jgi:hypothetical protein
MDFSKDFINVHNDDLIPIDTYEGITCYAINWGQAEEREIAFIQRLIELRKKNEQSSVGDFAAAS